MPDSLQHLLDSTRFAASHLMRQHIQDSLKLLKASAAQTVHQWNVYEYLDLGVASLGVLVTVIIAGQLGLTKFIRNLLRRGPIRVLWIEDNNEAQRMRYQILHKSMGIRVQTLYEDSGVEYNNKNFTMQLDANLNMKRWLFWRTHVDVFIVDISLQKGQNHTEWKSGIQAIQTIHEKIVSAKTKAKEQREKREKWILFKKGRLHAQHPVPEHAKIICYSKFFSANPYDHNRVPNRANHLRYFLEKNFGIPSYCIIPKTDDLQSDIETLTRRIYALAHRR